MKLISEGNPNFKPWWVGERVDCPDCRTVIELEEGDDNDASFTGGTDTSKSIAWRCKRCNEVTFVDRPRRK